MKSVSKRERRLLRSEKIEDVHDAREKLKLIVRYGLLAPSTHNTQPWKITIREDSVEVYADYSKEIPEADPIGRDLFISLGALLANIRLAGECFGLEPKVRIVDQLTHETDLVAKVTFRNIPKARTPKTSAILDAIVARQNYRGVFQRGNVSVALGEVLNDIRPSGVEKLMVAEHEAITRLADLTSQGLRRAYARPSFRAEISNYINHNLSSQRTGLHGYSLRMNWPLSIIIPALMKRRDIGKRLAKLNRVGFVSSSAVCVLASEDTPNDWVNIGVVLETVMVRLQCRGLVCSIYAAAIESPDLRRQLCSELVIDNDEAQPQIMFCVGKPGMSMPYSARHLTDEVVV